MKMKISNMPQKFAERRRFERVKMQMGLQCIMLDPSECDVMDNLYMTDFSRSGIGAVSDRLYYPGQRLMISMPLPDGEGKRNVYATVKRCAPDRQQGYRLGLEFDKITTGNWCGVAGSRTAAAAA